MIIADVEEAQVDDAALGWSSLRRFQNVTYVTRVIANLHDVKVEQRHNTIKQARQLRYCLVQAREYYAASSAVTLATQPTLLYYSAMSLALAEILLKHTGAASLDKAREQHRHHGLVFQDTRQKVDAVSLADTASKLIARPMVTSRGLRSGTFELWHQTARMAPLVGTEVEHGHAGGHISRSAVLGTRGDNRMPVLLEGGISLLDCLRAIPEMFEHLRSYNLGSYVLRGRVTQEIFENQNRHKYSIVVHPSSLVEQFFENVRLAPNSCSQADLTEFRDGGVISFIVSALDKQKAFPVEFDIPDGSARSRSETRFWPSPQPLNEFGYLYVALFIAGNYARYYPDRWQADVEETSELAVAVRDLLRIAEKRLAWLALGELARKSYVLPAP